MDHPRPLAALGPLALGLLLLVFVGLSDGPRAGLPGFLDEAPGTVTAEVPLRFAAAPKVAGEVREAVAEASRVEFSVDEARNALVLRGTERGIETIRALLGDRDVPLPQLLLDARVVRLDPDALLELRRGTSPRVDHLDTLLDLGRGELLAAPRLLATHGGVARIRIGEDATTYPAAATPADTDGYSISLAITPFLQAEREVTLRVRAQVTRARTGPGGKQIERSETESSLRVRSGSEVLLTDLADPDGKDPFAILIVPRILRTFPEE